MKEYKDSNLVYLHTYSYSQEILCQTETHQQLAPWTQKCITVYMEICYSNRTHKC